ncbi:MAG: SIMPL domain-containing protein [Bacteroidales bacterium]|nr:SIMPL domain-containing protein [Bacteroidales bacterium]
MKGSQIPFKKNYILGTSIVLAALVNGVLLFYAARTLKSYDDTVTVRGLCEREIMADRAIYPVVYKETGNDLPTLYASVNKKNAEVLRFLQENGIDSSEVSVSAPRIVDNSSMQYTNNSANRYVITSVLTVCTGKVQTVLDIQSRLSQLMDKGIAIGSGNEWENPAVFEFTALNDVKPAMIEEANKNARAAAEQFAKDSRSRLGKINSATQGLFSIENRDQNTPHIKRVRVVTNVSYRLR